MVLKNKKKNPRIIVNFRNLNKNIRKGLGACNSGGRVPPSLRGEWKGSSLVERRVEGFLPRGKESGRVPPSWRGK